MGSAGGGEGMAGGMDLILRSVAKRCISKDGRIGASWFETRENALLTMRGNLMTAFCATAANSHSPNRRNPANLLEIAPAVASP